MVSIQNQNFGVEIELTGITRHDAAQVIATYFGDPSRFRYMAGGYDTYTAVDSKGRTWKAVRDSSINCVRRSQNGGNAPLSAYACEIVTPILQYDDIPDLQNIVRALVRKGALANSSCGIHVHVDAQPHTPETLTRLMTFAIARQDLFYEALQIGDRADHWCKKMNAQLLKAMKADSAKTRDSLERIWYSAANDGYVDTRSHTEHYNPTRYHGINLHAYFTKGTVEFRLFNGTTHAGKIKAYIQFCLALSAWAVNAKDNLHFASSHGAAYETAEKRGRLMRSVLVKRLGMRGAEFKTARIHLLAAFQARAELAA